MATRSGSKGIGDIGIHAHQSKFAILAPDTTDSDEEESWETVKTSEKRKKGSRCKEGARSHEVHTSCSKVAVKNAKRRAKKRATSQSEKQQGDNKECNDQLIWQTTNEMLLEKEFESDLNKALLLSLEDKEKEDKEKQRMVETSQPHKSTKGKKSGGVTMSLQELHRMIDEKPSLTGSVRRKEPIKGDVNNFFDKIESVVQSELKKENQMKKRKEKTLRTINGKPNDVNESFYIAHLQDDLEKKNMLILKLQEENEKIKIEMNEVKVRNQVLCKMLSRGEFSAKVQLLEQIEELTTDKHDLTTELERLYRELEQERSKSKALFVEVAKLQEASLKAINK